MKQQIRTDKAPTAVGPYSQGIAGEQLIFVSGQLPINPETGLMPVSVSEQTEQSLKNLESVLESVGSGLDRVYKTTVFLKSMGDFAVMNQVYEAHFTGSIFPARSAVEVACLPKNALVEIEAIAGR